MKRYLISKDLRKIIRNNKFGVNKLAKMAGFNIKHIYGVNISIDELQLIKLKSILNINPKLKEFKQDYVKNLGKYAYTQPIKNISMGGDLAEFIGIVLGDGHFHKYGAKIAFDKRNEFYIEYVYNLAKKLFGINFKRSYIKNKNVAYLYCYNGNAVRVLLKYGLLIGDKMKNQTGVPGWIMNNKNYSKRCIKGLIDTDGCIYICKREKQRYVKFTNYNDRLRNDFLELVKGLGYNFAKANSKNFCLYRKDEVIRFINDIKPVKAITGAVVQPGSIRGLGLRGLGSNPSGPI